MLQPGQSLVFSARLTSQTLLSVSTDDVLLSELSWNWRALYWALHGTAPRYVSDRFSRVADLCYQSRLGVDFGQLPTNSLSIGPSHLVTVGERSLGFCWPKAVEESSRWHYICFITDICIDSHIGTLLYSLFVGVLGMVVVAVVDLGHLYNC